MTAVEDRQQSIPTLRVAARVGVFRGRMWFWTWIGWLTFYSMPLLTGWFLKEIFDALDSDEAVGRWLLALGLSEAARMVLFAFGCIVNTR